MTNMLDRWINPPVNAKVRHSNLIHGSKARRNMMLVYRENPDEWRRKYHVISSAETAFSAVKRRFVGEFFKDTSCTLGHTI